MIRPKDIADEITEADWNDILTRDLTFREIEAKYGQEVAIYAGIARDPDNPEWTEEDFATARPAIEVVPHIVEEYRRTRGKQKKQVKERVSIRLDADIAEHFRAGGPGWQTRLNETLREAVFGP